ncbi:MAG: hypothetical protein DMF84_27515 [Acidobacteria bacterium]|nr:MAG: hypothetical protein DMF84_27515 [Acidobacteriota bacterium]
MGRHDANSSRLLNHLGSVERVVSADIATLLQVRGAGRKKSVKFGHSSADRGRALGPALSYLTW